MENLILQRLKAKNPDKEYPSNVGQKWTVEEDKLLLEELHANKDIILIARSHNRTIGSITARQKVIAYKMYKDNIPIEDISNKVKLGSAKIIEAIRKREDITNTIIIPPQEQFAIESDIREIKKDIKELKTTIRELVEIMKAVYDFEDT